MGAVYETENKSVCWTKAIWVFVSYACIVVMCVNHALSRSMCVSICVYFCAEVCSIVSLEIHLRT